MRRLYNYLIAGVIGVMLAGCIENDIPYPIVKLDILTFEVEGTKSAPQIDATAHTVSIP